MKPHIYPFQIAYADTDAAGIVYHARFIEIAERARMSLCADINDSEGGFIVRELSVKYMRPVFLNDKIIVETTFGDIAKISMIAEQKFVKNGEVCAIMHIKLVYVNRELKPTRIPDVWLGYRQ